MNHDCTGCTMCRDETTTTLPRVIPLSEVRVGDTVRVEWPDVDVTLSRTAVVAVIDGCGDLRASSLRPIGPQYTSGRASVVVHLLDRPAPSLPTEPGDVIVDATIRGVEGCTAMLDLDGGWLTPGDVNGFRYHRPEHVTAWRNAEIRPVGEPVTR